VPSTMPPENQKMTATHGSAKTMASRHGGTAFQRDFRHHEGGSHTSGKNSAETALGGWGARIRTSASLLGSQCNAPRTPAATPRMRAKRPAAPGGRAGGRAPTGASGKRIHAAIWHIGEAGAALPTVRLSGASGVGWTPDAPES